MPAPRRRSPVDFRPNSRQNDERPPPGSVMIHDVEIFRTTITISALDAPERRRALNDVMVDKESEYCWIPADVLADLGIAPVETERFETADGRILERSL